jgi:hypothetical protein
MTTKKYDKTCARLAQEVTSIPYTVTLRWVMDHQEVMSDENVPNPFHVSRIDPKNRTGPKIGFLVPGQGEAIGVSKENALNLAAWLVAAATFDDEVKQNEQTVENRDVDELMVRPYDAEFLYLVYRVRGSKT